MIWKECDVAGTDPHMGPGGDAELWIAEVLERTPVV